VHPGGYSNGKQKCEKIASILRDVSVLIGKPKHSWVMLEMGGTVMPGLNLANEAAHLINCVNYIQQGIFKISVLGGCKTGKSTLLNALLGAQFLPAAPPPTTAVVTNLVYGEHSEVMIYEEGKEHLYPVPWNVFAEDFILSKSDIHTIDAQGYIDSRLKHIKYAQVERQYPFLANGVRLTDSPGLEVSINQPAVTPSFLKRPGVAVIVVLNAMHPFPKHVRTFLATVLGSKRRENVFFVINRLDQFSPEKIDPLKRHVRQMLRSHFINDNYAFDDDLYSRRVFFTSARTALEARIATPHDSAMLEASGMLLLEQELERFLSSQSSLIQTLEPLLQTLDYVVEKANERIAQEKLALAKDGKSGKSLPVVREKQRLDTIERKLLELVEEANRVVAKKPGLSLERQRTGTLLIEKSGPLEIGMDIDDHLDTDHLYFVEQVIERANIPAEVRTELRERLNEIFYRRTDPHLYMAVVGEFNSGKSTFINALLRQEVLKTSVLVATATSTRIRYGASPNVNVLFKKQKEPLSYLKDSARLWQLIHFFTRQEQTKDGDLRECIHFVTAIDRVATSIDHVVIAHPAPFLSDGIVIIDTPGMNAENPEHAQITTRLIEQEADAAVIVIPAPFALSLTLREFLAEQLRPFLHRCLFVVTQMDKIPEAEREMLLDNLGRRLANVLGSDQPVTLYEAAPKIVLDKLNERKTVPEELEHWDSRFLELENTLWERLHRERALSIAERLLRLLTHLFEQLEKHLREHQSDQELAMQSDLREIDRRRKVLQEKQQQLAAVVI
jgi:GTPase Era involved in 16S rRNA processing